LPAEASHCGHLFVFRGKRGDLVKLIFARGFVLIAQPKQPSWDGLPELLSPCLYRSLLSSNSG
jgi:hypothetical protein